MTKFYIIAFIPIFFIGKLSAQTVNTGELSILQGTVLATLANFDNKPSGDFINDGQFIVYANYNNDGLVIFSPTVTSGLTHFKGAYGAQTISGTAISEFNNVKFENRIAQPAFLLSGAISVFGVSDFDKGIISNNNLGGTFTFESDAIPDNASDDSHVDGYVERKGKNEFQFPIGDGGFFRPSAIHQTNSDKNLFISKYVLKNSNALYPHEQREKLIKVIDVNEYWEFKSNQSKVDVALTLGWNSNTTPDELINGNSASSLAIVRWDETDLEWKLYSSAVDMQNQTVTAAIDKSGVFTLAKIVAPTPDDDVIVYNALSPNGDGLNDYFKITGLEKFPDNSLMIYNRYGVKVFETTGYGENENWFRGISDGRVTINKDKGLPTGTYFYVLKFKRSNGTYNDKTGYLYINN